MNTASLPPSKAYRRGDICAWKGLLWYIFSIRPKKLAKFFCYKENFSNFASVNIAIIV